MAVIRRTGRPRLTLLFLVLSSATVITLDFRGDGTELIDAVRDGAGDALAPVRAAAGDVLDPVGDALSGLTGYGDLEAENEVLRGRLAELEGAALAGEEAARERDTLANLLELQGLGDIPSVGARVISVPISNFEQTIELDKGSSDGITEDMPVVTGTGLVGQVVSVSSDRSTVRLITDPAASVGVRLERSGDVGSAEGDGPGRSLAMAFVETATAVGRQELARTSGLEGAVFPGGIPVGRVVQSRAGAGELEQRVELEPIADLEHLSVVRILRWTSPS